MTDTTASTTMLACGHSATNTHEAGHDGLPDHHPTCVACLGILPGACTLVLAPDLTGRVAICFDCKRERPSATNLAFFEYRGPGSRDATLRCRDCSYVRSVHEGLNAFRYSPHRDETIGEPIRGTAPHPFVEHGPWDRDLFYDGCRGWD